MGGQRVAGRNLEETTPYGGPSCGGPTPAGVSTWQAQARKKQPVMGPQTLAGPMLFGTKHHSEEATRGRRTWQGQTWKNTPLMGTELVEGAGSDAPAVMGPHNVAGPMFEEKGPVRNQRVAGTRRRRPRRELSTWRAQASKKQTLWEATTWQSQFVEEKAPLRNQRVGSGNTCRNQSVAGAYGKETPLMGTESMAGANFEESTLRGTYNVAGPAFGRRDP